MSYSDCRFLFSIAYDAVKKYIDGSNRCMTVTEISELCDENTDDLFEEYYHLPINRGYNDYHRHTGFKSACNQFKQEMYRQMNEKNRKITREKEEKESNRKRKLDEDYKHAIIEISNEIKKKKMCCFKCGRNSHWANKCFAKKHLNGMPLNIGYCGRCGRKGHKSNNCFATTTIDGSKLTL